MGAIRLRVLAGAVLLAALPTTAIAGPQAAAPRAPVAPTAAQEDVSVSFGSGDVEPLVPARLLDTRDGIGAPAGKVGPASTTVLQVAGRGGVPAHGAGAVVLNVTSTEATQHGYVTVYPTGVARPEASNLNVPPGSTVPNLVIAKLGVGGSVSIFNSHGDAHLIADVTGWFPDVSGLQPMSPQRLLDTRDGVGAPVGPVEPASTTRLAVAGHAGIPNDGVGAVVLNVTVTQPSAHGYVTVFPSGTERPVASNLNFTPGLTVPNLVVAKVGEAGSVDLYNAFGTTHLIADVAGWFPETSVFRPVAPERLLDTRDGLGAPVGPAGPATTIPLQVTGRGPLPAAGVGAVVLNVTVTQPTEFGFLTAFPAGVERPTASNLNFRPGQTVPNLVVAKVGEDGVVNVYNSHGSSHVVADVVGWFPAAAGSSTELALHPGTLLAGPGDVVAATGSSDLGGTVTLAASADVPAVGGHLAVAPQPLAPSGMFGKVAEVSAQPDATTVTLVPAALDEGFADIRITSGEPATPSAAKPAVAAKAAECEGSGGLGLSPSVSFTANSVDFDLSLLEGTARLLMGGTASAGLAAEFSGSYECWTEFSGGLFVIGPTVVSVAPRLSITASAALTTSATLTGDVQLGFEKDAAGTRNLSDFGIDASGDLDAEATASLTVRPSFEATLKLFGVAGATIDLGVDVKGVVEPVGLPCVTLTAQATLDIGFEAGRWGVEWNVTLASLKGPALEMYTRVDGCPAQDVAWVGHIDVQYEQDQAVEYVYNEDGLAVFSYTWARSYSYRVESIASSLVNREYVPADQPDDVLIDVRSLSETYTHWIRDGGSSPCNSHYVTATPGSPNAWFHTELLTDPDSLALTDSPQDGDTVYLLVAHLAGATDYCSDGSNATAISSQLHLGDELDSDLDCLGSAVPASMSGLHRGYCVLPLTVTENGTRLRFQGTLSGTHNRNAVSTAASQTVDIDLRKISTTP